MASFAPIRGTKAEIQNTPIVDGQFLIETDQGDQNKIYIDNGSGSSGTRTMAGGGGHQMLPTPSSVEPTGGWDAAIKEVINSAQSTNENVASLFSIGRWSNTMTQRVIYNQTIDIGVTGIGTWLEDEDLEALKAITDDDERAAVESNDYGWWHDAHFEGLDTFDDYDISFKFKPQEDGEVLTLGGYILDTNTGYLCIKFGNTTITDTNKIAVDITITKNNVSYSS